MMSRLSRLALDAFTIISSFFFLSAVTDGRKGSHKFTSQLEILFFTNQLEILLKRGERRLRTFAITNESITSRDLSAVLFSKDL